MTTTLAFHGAARTVTGSKYLLDTGDGRTLIHAHIDHIGHLPRLVRRGFSGPVLATVPRLGEVVEI